MTDLQEVQLPGLVDIDINKPDVHFEVLRQNLGENFIHELTNAAEDKVEIPYDTEKQFGEAIAASRAFTYLKELATAKALNARVRAFRYKTPEGMERDVIFFSHSFQVKDGGESWSVVYLLDPQSQNGDLYSAYDLFLISSSGAVKTGKDIADEAKIRLQFSDDRKNLECQVSGDGNEYTMRWFETEVDWAMALHEKGHLNSQKSPVLAKAESDSTQARKNLGIYNFRGMQKSGVPIVATPEMIHDLGLISDSEVNAWANAQIDRLTWEKQGFGLCSDASLNAERDRALATYRERYEPLISAISGSDPDFFRSGPQQFERLNSL